MAQERAQPLILPQSGYLFPQAELGTLTRSFTAFAPNAPYSIRDPQLALSPPAGYVDNRQSLAEQLPAVAYPPVPLMRPAYLTNNNITHTDAQERDYQIITYDELEKMLPEPKPAGRIELGMLPNGSAYAPKTATRENYLLFPSKFSYILYFTHHYFSRENLSRDHTFLNMLVNRLVLPLDKLIKAPRLAALSTTLEEIEQALEKSKIVCLEDMGGGVRGVRRIDGYPAFALAEELTPPFRPQLDPPSSSPLEVANSQLQSPQSANYLNYTRVAAQAPFPSPQSLTVQPIAAESSDREEERRTNPTPLGGGNDQSLSASVGNKLVSSGYSFSTGEQQQPVMYTGGRSRESSTLLSPSSLPTSAGGGSTSYNIGPPPNQTVTSASVVPPPSAYLPTTTSTATSSTSANASETVTLNSSSNHVGRESIDAASSGRPPSGVWPQPQLPQQPGLILGPYNRYSLQPASVAQSNPMEANSPTYNSHTSVLGFPSRPGYPAAAFQMGGLQPTELHPVSVLPIRQHNALPPYLLGQTGHTPGPYPGSLSFCQMSTTGSPINLAMAAAIANQQQTLSQPQNAPVSHVQFTANQLFAGSANQIAALNPHQSAGGGLSGASYQMAVAALAAAAQQQQQQQQAAAYFQPPINPNIQSQGHHLQSSAAQSALPVYYAAQPLPIPAHLHRHPVQRLSHAPIYPIQAYPYQPQATVLHNPSELASTLVKSDTAGNNFSAPNCAASSQTTIGYPLLFQSPVQFHQQPNQHNSNLVASSLAAAAAGLHIQYPPPPARTPVNSFGLTPLPLSLIAISNPAPTTSLPHLNSTVTYKSTVSGSLETKNNNLVESSRAPSEGLTSSQNTPTESTGGTIIAVVSSSPAVSEHSALVSPSASSTSSTDNQSNLSVDVVAGHKLSHALKESNEINEEKTLHNSSTEDSEDSGSSGIGEMNSACSSGTSDARTTGSSHTLTGQVVVSGTTACAFVSCKRQSSNVNRAKDSGSKT
ncbi:unnamed protein product [Calicophoron daubneyi]|uniref:HTH La-type RNA-binding domain-containing protein n=1 Tax=Calicophoron daubneyi TaxID=300641 RepID=A0AAV2T720_CALDB